jgi:hypothetical protein
VVLDGLVVPAPEHWRSWARSLAEAGYATMRTGALSPRQAHQAELAGMRCVQELALLDLHRSLPFALGAVLLVVAAGLSMRVREPAGH